MSPEIITRSSSTAEITRVAVITPFSVAHSGSPISVIGTNRKPVRRFMLVNNNLYLSRTISKL